MLSSQRIHAVPSQYTLRSELLELNEFSLSDLQVLHCRFSQYKRLSGLISPLLP